LPTENEPLSDAPALIGIDVGTSSIRAIAFDPAGHKIAVGSRPTPTMTVATGAEYDPNAIFSTVLEVLTEVGSKLGGRPVAGMAVASIGESFVLIGPDGRAVAPAIAWFDRRTEPQAHAIIEKIGRARLFAISGLDIDRSFALAKLMWMREHWPDRLAKAHQILMMADWVAFCLSGKSATDPSLASRTLYFDISNRCWSHELLALAGVEPDFPAPLAASGTALGPVQPGILAQTGLAGSPMVAVGGHDHVMGAIGVGLDGTTAVDSLGTAEGIYLAVAQPLGDPQFIKRGFNQGAMETDRPMTYLGGAIFSSGGAMEWLRGIVGDISMPDLIQAAAQIPPGSNGVVFLPHLANSPPPDPDEHGRGAFVGLTSATTAPVLYRSVLEGLAMQSRLILDGMADLAGVEPHHIRLIGGGTRNALFCSIKANVFARPVHVVEEAEATAQCAALLGGVAGGMFANLGSALAGLDRKETMVSPDDSAGLYDQLRTQVFESLHNQLRPINRSLAGIA
jgi:xylulokinase